MLGEYEEEEEGTIVGSAHSFTAKLDSKTFEQGVPDPNPRASYLHQPLYHHGFHPGDIEEVKSGPKIESKEIIRQARVVLLGAIDNRASLGLFGMTVNSLKDKFGIKPDNSATRIENSHRLIGKPDLTVTEHVMDKLAPFYEVCDYTNYGFTSGQVLSGGKKNTALGDRFPNLYPSEEFRPLMQGEKDIIGAAVVVLGETNDIGVFLERLARNDFKNSKERTEYIQKGFFKTIADMQNNYLAIMKQVRDLNPKGRIVVMTPYYPSFNQNDYKIYELLTEVARTLSLHNNPDVNQPKFVCKNPNNPRDVIHALMKFCYKPIFNKIAQSDNSVIVADVTSSLDPLNENNHTMQTQVNGVGGKKIAQILNYIISHTSSINSESLFQFLPKFFSNKKAKLGDDILSMQISEWEPKHPNAFITKVPYDTAALRVTLDTNNKENFNYEAELSKDLANENFRDALIIVNQILPNSLTPKNYDKIKNMPELQSALVAAHGYYNSGRFGFFRTHGSHGRRKTEEFVKNLMNFDKPGWNMLKEMQSWLKSSNIHNSSRAFYAANSGYFKTLFPNGNNYATATDRERKQQLSEMTNERLVRQFDL